LKLYRYIDYDRFKEMINDKQLAFVNPFKYWEDKKEGYLYKMAREDKYSDFFMGRGLDEFKKQLKSGALDKEIIGQNMDWFRMRCICLSKNKCSFEIMKNYKFNFGVCFEIESADLLKLKYNQHKVEGMNVEYRKCLDKDDIKKIIRNHQFPFTQVLSLKSADYIYENEFRAYVCLLDKNGQFELSEDLIKVNIDIPIDKFINRVFPYPNLSEKDSNELHNFCNEKGIVVSKWEEKLDE